MPIDEGHFKTTTQVRIQRIMQHANFPDFSRSYPIPILIIFIFYIFWILNPPLLSLTAR